MNTLPLKGGFSAVFLIRYVNSRLEKITGCIIVKVIRPPFNHCRLYVFLYLFGMVLINILLPPCFGMATGYPDPVFSITSTNEPLYNVLAKISKVTGYRIEITKGWGNKSSTVDLKNVTLENGIKAVIRSIGEPSHALIVDNRMRKVEIRIFDASPGSSSYKGEKTPMAEMEQVTGETKPVEMEEHRQRMEMEAEREAMETEEHRRRMEVERQQERRPETEIPPPPPDQ